VVNFFTSLWRKMFPTVLHGTRYHFTVSVEGEDLVVRNVSATWFGGQNDKQDNGTTASGVSTLANPWLIGCALPMDNGFPLGKANPCQGSPLPKIPWGTRIDVLNNDNGLSITATLIDYGPSAPPEAHASIDLTPSGFMNLGGKLAVGVLPNISYRIPGGAKILGLS
jgi:hypothetical protein